MLDSQTRLQQGFQALCVAHKKLSSLESENENEQKAGNNGTYFKSKADHFKQWRVNINSPDNIVKGETASRIFEEQTTTNLPAGCF